MSRIEHIHLWDFTNHWVRGGNPSAVASQLEMNIQEFATQAGQVSKSFFNESFYRKSFEGKRWAPYRSSWGKLYHTSHTLLLDTERLRQGIRAEHTGVDHKKKNQPIFAHSVSYGSYRRKIKNDPFARRATYELGTSETGVAIKGKRGSNGGKGYAAIHNEDPVRAGHYFGSRGKQKSTPKRRYPSKKRKGGPFRPVRRQFMGNSRTLDMMVKPLIPIIFNNIHPFYAKAQSTKKTDE